MGNYEAAISQGISWLAKQQQQMQNELVLWCEQNSGSFNLSGLSQQADLLHQAFSPLFTQHQRHTLADIVVVDDQGQERQVALGEAISYRHQPATQQRKIFLAGHMDTVYPADHPFQSCQLSGNRLNGPGVADMKGGLIVMNYALRAFMASELREQLAIDVLLTPDEEIGSPGSAPLLAQFAKQHDIALIFEPAMDEQGSIASSRKGSGKLTLVTHGIAAHAGRSFDKGRSAILAMGQLLAQIDALNALSEDVTVNVGMIKGGSAVNVVPEYCVARIDVRYAEEANGRKVEQHLSELVAKQQSSFDGVSISLYGGLGRLPKKVDAKLQALLASIGKIAQDLGYPLQVKPSGGVCDGNNLAAAGVAVVDSLGVRGGRIHSPDEFLIIESLVERAQITFVFLMQLASGAITL